MSDEFKQDLPPKQIKHFSTDNNVELTRASGTTANPVYGTIENENDDGVNGANKNVATICNINPTTVIGTGRTCGLLVGTATKKKKKKFKEKLDQQNSLDST